MVLEKLKRDGTGAAILFFTVLLAFLISLVHQFADSKYSMLLSQSLLQYQSFSLDDYSIPEFQRNSKADSYQTIIFINWKS